MDKVGRITGYAWSQSLGWVNFGGVYAGIKITVPINVNTPAGCPASNSAGLCGCFGAGDPSGDPSKLDPTLDAGSAGAVKVADGVDKYVLNLYFKDENGVDIPKAKFDDNTYEAKLFFNWEDRIRRDQTNVDTNVLSYNGDKVSKPFQNSAGATLQKPVFLYTTANAAAADSLFGSVSDNETGTLDNSKEALTSTTFNISSVAPTYNANISKIEGKSGTVKNDDLSLVPGFAHADEFKAAPNELKLNSIEWAIWNKTSGQIIRGISYFDDAHGRLEFKPALEISKLSNGLSANTLWMFRNVPVEVGVEGKSNVTGGVSVNSASIDTFSEMFVSGVYKFDIGFTSDSLNTLKTPVPPRIDKSSNSYYIKALLMYVGSVNKFDTKLEAILSNTDANSLPENYSEGSGIYSKINYKAFVAGAGTKDVTYFSNHLPRIVSTAVSNPSVVIQGTTYSQGQQVFSPQQGVSITGIGDQNVNIVRDLVFENIQKLLIDQKLPTAQGTVTITSLAPTCVLADGCLKIDLEKETVYYFDASNLIIENADLEADLYVSKNTVFVVKGGNIHINNNIYPTEASTKNNRVGFVVLGDDKLYHGHIYIGPNVTNIRALMIADGTLFSAKNDYISSGDDYGEPPSITPADFNHQLLIEGGISTRNCIGCVDKADQYYSIPRDPLLEKTDTNKEIAKKYDLNYLRYFSLQLEYDDEGNPIDQQKVGEPGYGEIDPLDPVSEGGDLVPPTAPDNTSLQAQGLKPEQTNPVYVKYLPPSPDSFVFSKEKGLTF
jgi:hypothetical protein